jgi:hypothetical protein
MASSKKQRNDIAKRKRARPSKKQSEKPGNRKDIVLTMLRLMLLVWDVIWTLIHEHVIRGTALRPS